MKRLLIILFCFPLIVFAQLKVAILDFENTSGIEKYDGLGKAMSNMLITDLKNNISDSKVVFVERSQLNKILDEQDLQKSKNFDEKTAVNFGKLSGVDFVIIGNVYVLDDMCNISSRMVNVETSEIEAAKEVNGLILDWIKMKSQIAIEFANVINYPISIGDADQTISEGVLVQYSKIIEAVDQENIEFAEDMIQMMKDLQVELNYLDILTEDIKVIKAKLKELEEDVKELEITTKVIQEDLSALRKVINEDIVMEIKEPESITDFLSNIHYHKIKSSDFTTRIESYDQMFLNYQINFLDVYIEYYNLLCEYDYSETYDNDYTEVIEKIHVTIENSCSNSELKDFLILYFSHYNQPSAYFHSLSFGFGMYEGANDEKYIAILNKKIIDKYDILLTYFHENADNNLIKSLWLHFTPYVNQRISFNHNFYYFEEAYDGVIGNDETSIVPIEQFRWFVKQVDLLASINTDFDYKDIDSYFLNKQNATFYIKSIQSIIPDYKKLYLEYNKIKDNQEVWIPSESRLGMYLFLAKNVPEIINSERNWRVVYYPDGSKKTEGFTVILEHQPQYTKRQGCNNEGRCWDNKVISYHKDGKISLISFYNDGWKEGLHTSYYETGEIKKQTIWNRDNPVLIKVFFRDGTLKEEHKYEGSYSKVGVDTSTYYYDNGYLKGEQTYFLDQENRPKSYVEYYKSGKIKAKLEYDYEDIPRSAEDRYFCKYFECWNEKGDIIDCLNTSVFDYYVGAGMDISKNKDGVIVIDEVYNNIFSHNPANEAKLKASEFIADTAREREVSIRHIEKTMQDGLRAGDIILEIDGRQIIDQDIESVTKLLKGITGTIVTIKIRRKNKSSRYTDYEIKTFDVTRKEIHFPILGSPPPVPGLPIPN